MKLSRYFQDPTALIILTLITVLGGAGIVFTLPIKMYPDMVKPSYFIGFNHKDVVLPSELYKAYGRNFEARLRDLEGIESVAAVYSRNRGRYTLNFGWNADEKEIERQVDAIFSPAVASSNGQFSYGSHSVSSTTTGYMRISVSSEAYSRSQLGERMNHELVPVLEDIPGVKGTWVGGRVTPQTVLEVNLEKLLAFGLDLPQLEDAVLTAINAQSAGSLDISSSESVDIVIPAAVTDLRSIGNQPIRDPLGKGRALRISDVAKLVDRLEPDRRISRLNGIDGTFVYVSFEPTGDILAACKNVEQALKEFQGRDPRLNYAITVNPSEFIDKSIESLLWDAFSGGLIAMVVIYLFLGAFSNTMIIAVSIPFSALSSFFLMKYYGVTINLVSLGGMAIGVGMIIDSSIVALENIFRRLSKLGDQVDPIEKAREVFAATQEVAVPIVASALTAIVVFFPVLYAQSYSRAVLGDLAKAVIFINGTAVFAALLIIPGLCTRFIQIKPSRLSNRLARPATRIMNAYVTCLDWILATRGRAASCIAAATMLFGISLLFAPKIRREIIAQPNSALAEIRLELPDNDDIELTRTHASRIEKWLSAHPRIESHSSNFRPDGGEITARMKNSQDFDDLKKEFLANFRNSPEATIDFGYYDPGAMPLPKPVDLVVDVAGARDEDLSQVADRIEALVRTGKVGNIRRTPRQSQAEGISLVFNDWIEGVKKLRQYVAAAGANGYWFTSVIENGEEKSVRIAFDEKHQLHNIDQLKALPVPYDHRIVPLKAIATVKDSSDSYFPLHFLDGVQKVQLTLTVSDSVEQKSDAVAKLISAINALPKPEGVVVSYPDGNKEINLAFTSFQWTLVISIALIFVILAVMFNSLRYPLIILTTVPFSLIGVIIGLWVWDSTISLNSMLGVILLAGVVVNNGILMIEFYLANRADDPSAVGAIGSIREACVIRMRPILMTTISTLFGVVPVAVGYGDGGEILQPLGIAITSGLFISTLLTLFVVPCMLRLADFWHVCRA